MWCDYSFRPRLSLARHSNLNCSDGSARTYNTNRCSPLVLSLLHMWVSLLSLSPRQPHTHRFSWFIALGCPGTGTSSSRSRLLLLRARPTPNGAAAWLFLLLLSRSRCARNSDFRSPTSYGYRFNALLKILYFSSYSYNFYAIFLFICFVKFRRDVCAIEKWIWVPKCAICWPRDCRNGVLIEDLLCETRPGVLRSPLYERTGAFRFVTRELMDRLVRYFYKAYLLLIVLYCYRVRHLVRDVQQALLVEHRYFSHGLFFLSHRSHFLFHRLQ